MLWLLDVSFWMTGFMNTVFLHPAHSTVNGIVVRYTGEWPYECESDSEGELFWILANPIQFVLIVVFGAWFILAPFVVPIWILIASEFWIFNDLVFDFRIAAKVYIALTPMIAAATWMFSIQRGLEIVRMKKFGELTRRESAQLRLLSLYSLVVFASSVYYMLWMWGYSRAHAFPF